MEIIKRRVGDIYIKYLWLGLVTHKFWKVINKIKRWYVLGGEMEQQWECELTEEMRIFHMVKKECFLGFSQFSLSYFLFHIEWFFRLPSHLNHKPESYPTNTLSLLFSPLKKIFHVF